MVIENAKVAFAQITGEGNDNGKYLIGVFVDKKQLKAVDKLREKTWDKGNTGTRKAPMQSLEDWCDEDEETGKKFLWLSCDADPDNPSHGLDYIVGEGDNFNTFMTKKGDKKKENVGRALLAVQLLDLVPFEGGSTPTTLKGKKLSQDGTSKKKADKPKKDKKKKKK